MSPLALSLRLLQTQPDARLLALAKDGHEAAFEALVRRYRRPLLAYSQRVSNGMAAEDVLQQALLQAWRALGTGVQVNDARAWLYRIVHNAAISAARSAGERPSTLVETASAYGVDHVVEQRLAAREALTQLAALPELQREVMLGTALEGRSHEELASELGLSGGSVRGLVYRARATLRTAAAAVIPSPIVDWAVRSGAAVRAGPPYEALVGGGSAGVAGVLIKGGVAATFVGALAGAAAVVSHHPAPRVPEAARPARHHVARAASDPSASFVFAAVAEPARSAAQSGAGSAEPSSAVLVRRIGKARWALSQEGLRHRPATSSVSRGESGSQPPRDDGATRAGKSTSSSGGNDTSGDGRPDGADQAMAANAGSNPQSPGTGRRPEATGNSGSDSAPPATVNSGPAGTSESTSSGQGGDGTSGGSGSGGGQPILPGTGSLPQPVPSGDH